jgi:hypothetical protein
MSKVCDLPLHIRIFRCAAKTRIYTLCDPEKKKFGQKTKLSSKDNTYTC